MWGRLSWAAIPLHKPLPMVSAAVIGVVLLAVMVWVIARGHSRYMGCPQGTENFARKAFLI